MKITQVVLLSCLFLALPLTKILGQNASVKLGPTEIGVNQYFTIAITIKNDNIKKHSPFPDIRGFVKRGTSSSSSTSFINGQISSSHTITQNYQPTEQGTYQLQSFQIKVNDEVVRQKGATIKVGEPVQRQRRSAFNRNDPFDRFFGRPDDNSARKEYIDVQADAFLSLNTDKKEVYVGEGFTTTLAFYVSSSNRAELRFHELNKQVTEIVKKIKPERCWEENFNIENIEGQPVTINGKRFTKYTIYQATFFPLNVEDIHFPAVGLELIKYKVAKNPSFFGRNRQEDFETFYSRAKTVKVKALPPHPLRDQVAVGQYRLEERINPEQLETGQSFNYSFNIYGRGNISSIAEPQLPDNEDIDFYAPNTQQNINRANEQITGSKTFSYYGIPNEPGEYKLGDYFRWIYFNPVQEKYDTLSASARLRVTGKSRKNSTIMSNDAGSFYDRINNEDNNLVSLEKDGWVTIAINSLLVVVVLSTAYLMLRRV